MKIKDTIRITAALFAAMTFTASCDDETGSLGIFPEGDGIVNSDSIYYIYTRSCPLDSVMSNSFISYLGNITDPETKTNISANFAAQFHTFENYRLPPKELMFPVGERANVDAKKVKCESMELRLYFNSYYGDGNNPMKLEVYPLDINKVMEEDSVFYTNVDLEQFVAPGTMPVATKVFTPRDYILTESELTSSNHTDNVRISLPESIGTRIMNLCYDHPEYFKDSYAFIRNVCPGFYFKLKSGLGTMLAVDVCTTNIYFNYYDKEKKDTVFNSLARFAATPEVIQSTRFNNDDLRGLIEDKTCTYIKTPAGICTEMTLPVKDIFCKEHQADSVSKAKVTLTRYNNKENTAYSLGIPQKLLMVRKKDMYSFFENHCVSDAQTSYTTSYDKTYNTYTFENICRLVSYCQHEKITGMAKEGLSEAEWEAAHPDWNVVVLIPVKVSTTTNSYTGMIKEVSVTHDMDMNSIRLVGGPNSPIQMQVIYSGFNKGR